MSNIKLCVIGDVFLGGEYLRFASKRNIAKDYPFEEFKKTLSGNDILFLNLEGPISEAGSPRNGVSSILSNHPDVLDFGKLAPICIMNLGNNHIMDYGTGGLEDTIRLLEENNIRFVGAGSTIKEASRELVIECKGKKIGVLAFTSDEPHVGAVIAGDKDGGCASFQGVEEVAANIRKLKSEVDLILISLHWGSEYHYYPSIEQVNIAHRFADEGADLIIGHHPHVVQGIEEYNKKSLIIYSVGNFFLPGVRLKSGRLEHRRKISQEFISLNVDIANDRSFAYSLTAGQVSKDFKLIEYRGRDANRFNKRMTDLSSALSGPKYEEYLKKYYIDKKVQIEMENLFEALKKIYRTPLSELVKTVSVQDIKRNVNRLLNIARGWKGL